VKRIQVWSFRRYMKGKKTNAAKKAKKTNATKKTDMRKRHKEKTQREGKTTKPSHQTERQRSQSHTVYIRLYRFAANGRLANV
jgi:hypothetical protein